MNAGKLLIFAGIILILVGGLWTLFGKLPGDITIKRENVTFHFPIMTSIVVSIILSIIMFIIGKMR